MINLLPPEIKKNIKFAKRNVALVQYTFVVILVGFALFAILAIGIVTINIDEKNLQKSIVTKEETLANFQTSVDEAKNLSKTIDLIDTLINQEILFSNLIEEIGSLLPEGAYLSNLSLAENNKQLELTANVDKAEIAAQLRTNLVESELFSGVDIVDVKAGEKDQTENPKYYQTVLIVQFSESIKELQQ